MNGIVQFRDLGEVRLGRFGNQLSEYIFARCYADSIGARLETWPWIGQVVFEDINDPPPSCELPTLGYEELPDGRTNINLNGIYQSPEAQAIWTRDDAKRIYRFKPRILNGWVKPESPFVVAHLRRGDYCSMGNGWQVIVKHAFEAAIRKAGYDLSKVTWVSDLHVHPNARTNMPAIRDFVKLCHADVLFMSNLCTFSYWAALLGNAKVFTGRARVLDRADICPRNKFIACEFDEATLKA